MVDKERALIHYANLAREAIEHACREVVAEAERILEKGSNDED